MQLSRTPLKLVLLPLLFVFVSLFLQGCKDDAAPTGPVISLTPPAELTAQLLPAGYVKLTWKNRSTNESGFLLERKTLNGIYKTVASIGAGITTFTDSTTKIADSTFVYRLKAVSGTQSGAYSDTVAVSLLLVAPTALTLSNQTDTTITISWTDNATIRTGYQVERKQGAGAWTAVAQVNVPVTSFTDTATFTGQTQVLYRVRSTGPSIIGSPSPELTVNIVFDAPTNVAAVFAADSSVTVTWNDNTTGETQFFMEYKDTARAGTWTAVTLGPNTVSTTVSKTFLVNADYNFRVYAKGKKRTSQLSAVAVAKSVFSAPSFFTVTGVAPNNITMTWADNSSFENSFEVERKSPTGSFIRISLAIGPNVTSYTDTTTLLSGTTYQYRVRAKSLKGNFTPYSNIDSARAPAAEKIVISLTEANGQKNIRVSKQGNFSSVILTGLNTATGEKVTITLAPEKEFYTIPYYLLSSKMIWSVTGIRNGRTVCTGNSLTTQPK